MKTEEKEETRRRGRPNFEQGKAGKGRAKKWGEEREEKPQFGLHI